IVIRLLVMSYLYSSPVVLGLHQWSDLLLTLPPPPPLRFTLFPYTTLFRSPGAHSGTHVAQRQPAPVGEIRLGRGRVRGGSRLLEDRKSTRLNSSHSQISYAVFCLQRTTEERARGSSHGPSHAALTPADCSA